MKIAADSGCKKNAQPGRQTAKGKQLWVLFRTCFIISACTFGGGMVIITMLQKKFVDDLGWIEADEIMDMVALAQSCPGVMAINTAIMIGYRIAGIPGALLNVVGSTLPPMLILSVISVFYAQFRSNAIVSLVLRGMQAGVAAVMIHTSAEMIREVLRGKRPLQLILLLAAAAAAIFWKLDILIILAVCGAVGGCAALLTEKRRKEQDI